MADDTILETRQLTKEFKGFVAVKNVDLRIRRGTVHALIGPNGAGKTTCFNLLTHFLTPTRGQIFYKGREITGSRPAAIARMGLVRSFQISAVFPNLTVLENVRIALQRKQGHSFDFWRSEAKLSAYRDRALELIAAVGLSDFAPTGLSHSSFQKIRHALSQPPCALPSHRTSSRNTVLSIERISASSTQVLNARLVTRNCRPANAVISGMNGSFSSVPSAWSVARISLSGRTSTTSPGKNFVCLLSAI